MKMSKKDYRRLVQLHAMLGSSNAGEAESARQRILELLSRYRKNWSDLTNLLKGDAKADADTWAPAWDDNRSAEQHANDAVNAGLPEAAVKEPNVLELVRFILEEYVDMKPHEYIAAALWTLHSHVFERFPISPRLAFTSPVNGCGKTTALAVIEKMAFRPERMDNATPAVIYHLIDRLQGGTLLVDEADNLGLRENGILRSVLNSGHRKGGNIRRVIKGAPKEFSTFAPMAIAAIGSLPLPLMRRSIIVHMEKTATSTLKRFDPGDRETMERIDIVYGFVRRWVRNNPKLDLDPDLPKDLKNRVADNWRVLISIADCFGPTWAELARGAAITFARTHHDEDAGVILLNDIRDIFNRTGADRMASIDLFEALLDIDESGWAEYRGMRDDHSPRKLTPGEMARLLRPFGIHPCSVWPVGKRRKGTSSRKGYWRSQFENAWARYCEPTAGTAAQGSKVAYIGRR